MFFTPKTGPIRYLPTHRNGWGPRGGHTPHQGHKGRVTKIPKTQVPQFGWYQYYKRSGLATAGDQRLIILRSSRSLFRVLNKMRTCFLMAGNLKKENCVQYCTFSLILTNVLKIACFMPINVLFFNN